MGKLKMQHLASSRGVNGGATEPWQLGILRMCSTCKQPTAAADADARDFRLILNYFSYGMENK